MTVLMKSIGGIILPGGHDDNITRSIKAKKEVVESLNCRSVSTYKVKTQKS